jgi:hypothetical protein
MVSSLSGFTTELVNSLIVWVVVPVCTSTKLTLILAAGLDGVGVAVAVGVAAGVPVAFGVAVV